MRRGFGVRDKALNRLKSLAPSYVKQRRKSRLSSTTSASRSNLTRTGAMLASIRGFVKKLTITIRPVGRTNQEKANLVSGDRPFLDLSAKEEAKLVKSVEDSIVKELNKIFK